MKTRFGMIPRIAVYEDGKEPILFLPDLKSNPGRIACYVRVGEHGEADIGFYRNCTRKPDKEALALAEWYALLKCAPEDNAVIRQRWQRRA